MAVGFCSKRGEARRHRRVEEEVEEAHAEHVLARRADGRGGDGAVYARVDAPPADELGSRPYQPYGGLRNEWVFIDERSFDRLGHAGETIIPGSGERWGHVYEDRYGPRPGVGATSSASERRRGGQKKAVAVDEEGGAADEAADEEEDDVDLGPEAQQVFSLKDQEEEAARKLDELP